MIIQSGPPFELLNTEECLELFFFFLPAGAFRNQTEQKCYKLKDEYRKTGKCVYLKSMLQVKNILGDLCLTLFI